MIHLKKVFLLPFYFLVGLSPMLAQSTFPTDRTAAQTIQAKGSYLVDALHGAGTATDELAAFACLGKDAVEKNTHWFRFDASENTTLTFSLAPLQIFDDLDFELYQATATGQLQSLRCSGSGKVLGETKPNDACLGVVGLGNGAKGNTLAQGCTVAERFLAPVSLQKGGSYFLMVHNYSSAKGFSLIFGNSLLQTTDLAIAEIGEVYPNPTTQDAFLPITLPTATSLELLLLRANGQIVQRKTLDLPAGKQTLTIPLPEAHATELLYVRVLLNGQVVHRKVVLAN